VNASCACGSVGVSDIKRELIGANEKQDKINDLRYATNLENFTVYLQ
jgi:hypothetical protein